MASVSEKKLDILLNLPNDPKILKTAIANINIALNKSVKEGLFELKEASQLYNDITIITGITEQILHTYPKDS